VVRTAKHSARTDTRARVPFRAAHAFPFDRLPVLETGGAQVAESAAIARLIAPWAGLAADDAFAAAKLDMVCDACKDLEEVEPIFNVRVLRACAACVPVCFACSLRRGIDAGNRNRCSPFNCRRGSQKRHARNTSTQHTRPVRSHARAAASLLQAEKIEAHFTLFGTRMAQLAPLLGNSPFFGGDAPRWADFTTFHFWDLTVALRPSAGDAAPAVMTAWAARMHALPAVAAHIAARAPAGPGASA
jgi:glutathione S-transferase